ncbi:UNVERIFIED_CONTAM: hypothetical protein Sangu_2790800 [Sesamum angustifolium]|uniref:Uncharacterized protein n=1 Tax=Sesamum angustifolium TaxID=2727405 RepID=A0AAW2IRV3_9LAMI
MNRGTGSASLTPEGETLELKTELINPKVELISPKREQGDDAEGESVQRAAEEEIHSSQSAWQRKRVVKPSKVTKEMDADKELSKFINYCNEVKAATVANKDGGQLSIVKPQADSSSGAKK